MNTKRTKITVDTFNNAAHQSLLARHGAAHIATRFEDGAPAEVWYGINDDGWRCVARYDQDGKRVF
jgi:hypothetical protein